VAGIDWQARILPVRVLGSAGSGTLVDIVDGILWAAGLDVPGVPRNPHPADVINLSLGGEGACLPFMQDALNRAARQAIIVAAAGNVNRNAADFVPARCSSVITVGATDNAARRASYSNHGSRIDLMAPGGDLSMSAGSVLSLGGSARTGAFGYTEMQGTSMAAPHVAGVISLMKALEPGLGWQEALAILQASARPLSNAACNNRGSSDGRTLTGSDCGAGLIDAFLALQYVRDGVAPPVPDVGFLQFKPAMLDFGSGTEVMEFELFNAGTRSLDWELASYVMAADNPGVLEDGAIQVPGGSPYFGMLAPGTSVTTRVSIDRSRALPDSNYQLGLVFELAGNDSQVLELRFSTITDNAPGLTGPMMVAAFLEDSRGELHPSGHVQRAGVITDFRFDALPGDNIVTAWSDENGNGAVDAGDYFGTHPYAISVTPESETSGVTVRMARVIDGISVPGEATGLMELLGRAAPPAQQTPPATP
jgi:serine protease